MDKKCPYTRKPCMKDDCMHWRTGVRKYQDGRADEAIAGCVHQIAQDTREQMLTRLLGNQAAMEGLRNNLTLAAQSFYDLARKKDESSRRITPHGY